VLKQVVDLAAPYIAELFNRSLAVGHLPSAFKQASITPVQKKPGLDPADPGCQDPSRADPWPGRILAEVRVSYR